MRTFIRDCTLYTDQSVRYIMHKFPKLRILVVDTNLAAAVYNRLSEDVMLEFFKYALRINCARIEVFLWILPAHL
jgi:hypothetical protein